MFIPIKVSIPLPPIAWFKSCFLKGKNLVLRPKLTVKMAQKTICFLAKDATEHHLRYFYFSITNESNKEIIIDMRDIYINNESYQFIIQGDENFLRLNPQNGNPWANCKNDIYRLYFDNWYEISQGEFNLNIKPNETKIFPLKLVKNSSRIMTGTKNSSFLFQEKSKLSITLRINRQMHEYGVDRLLAYNAYINYLAFYMDVN